MTDTTVAQLLRQLDAATAELREAAQHQLASLGEAALEPLLRALPHPVRNVRLGAALALGQLGDTRAVASLLAMAAGADAKDLPLVLRAISDLAGPQADDALKVFFIRQLQHADMFVRALACRGLGRIGDTAARQALELAARDKEKWVRDAARLALVPAGETAAPAAAQALTTRSAALALREAAPDAEIGALHSLDPAVQQRAQDALAARGPSVVPQLRRQLGSEARSTRRAAIEVLGRVGGLEAVVALGQLLHDDDLEPQLRAAALYALGRATAPGAASAAGESPAASDFPRALVEAHLDDRDVYVRAAAIVCLLHAGGEARRGALRALVDDDDEWVHVAGLRAFSALASPADRLLRDTLLEGMGRISEAEAQAHLLLGLAKILEPPLEEDQVIVGPTSFFLEHPQQAVRHAALLLLLRAARQLDAPLLARIHELLERDHEAETMVARALGRVVHAGQEAPIALLVRLTRSANLEVVDASVKALGRVGGMVSVDALVALANSARSAAHLAAAVLQGIAPEAEVVALRDEDGHWQRRLQPRCACGAAPVWGRQGEREELRCPNCNSEYVQATNGRLFAADRTPFGVCLCCTRKQPLVRSGQGQTLVCPTSQEVHIRPHDAPRQILRLSALPFGACRCCPEGQPLVPVGERVVCRRTRREHQAGPDGYQLPSAPAGAVDINAINEALLGGSLDIGQSGVPVARRSGENE